MPGGRLKQYGPGKPDGQADKGLLDVNQGANVPPTPVPRGPASIAGGEQFEAVDPSSVAGGKKGTSQHAGSPDGSGDGPSFKAQAASRGIVEQSGLFAAQKGRSPKRGPGKVSPKKGVEDWGAR